MARGQFSSLRDSTAPIITLHRYPLVQKKNIDLFFSLLVPKKIIDMYRQGSIFSLLVPEGDNGEQWICAHRMCLTDLTFQSKGGGPFQKLPISFHALLMNILHGYVP